jgi:hypothetical protein
MLHFLYWNTHVDKFHDFVEDVARWNIRWALVDGKPARLIETLHATTPDLNTRLYTVSSVSIDNAGVVGNKQEIFSVQ